MGIYYQPPLANIGGQQPLTPQPLTPPSGPAPSNPVFGAVSLVATLVAAWSATAAPLPQQAGFVPPQITVAAPPLRQPGTPSEILAWWIPAPPLPPVAVNLDPPIAGPIPQAPPIQGGASVSEAVLLAWLPAPPLPPAAINLDPPLSGPVPQAPPIRGSASIPAAVLVQWLPPPPQAPMAVNLDPPLSGPAPQAPPIRGGATIPAAVLVQWLPPPPQAPMAVNLDPPLSGPVPQAPPLLVRSPAIDIAWLPSSTAAPPRILLPAAVFIPAATLPPPSHVGAVEIAVWWASRDTALPVLPQPVPPPSGPLAQAPPLQASPLTAILAAWVVPGYAMALPGNIASLASPVPPGPSAILDVHEPLHRHSPGAPGTQLWRN